MAESSVDMSGALAKFKKLKQVKLEVMKPAADFFIAQTPYKTGNARANTTLSSGDQSIHASYPYASVLDAGRGYRDGQMRGSTQAPNGMTIPTVKYITQLVNSYITKWGSKG